MAREEERNFCRQEMSDRVATFLDLYEYRDGSGVGVLQSVFIDLFSPNRKSLATNKSIEPKPQFEKKESKLAIIEQSSCQLRNFTIQNQPTLKMKGADYLGRVIAAQNRTRKVDSYWLEKSVNDLWN
jgi:hypothetical protein